MFGIKKTKKEVNGKNTYAVSFIGEDKMLGTDRDILTLRINSQIINFMSAYDHIDYYLAGIGDFDNLVLKVLNFYRGTDGKLAKGQCYIVNSDLECVRYEDVDPFYCPPTDKTVVDRIRKFLIEGKMLLSYVEGKSSPLFRYYEEAIVKNGLVMNFYLA